MTKNRGTVDRLLEKAHGAGHGVTIAARAAAYGTRYSVNSNAGTAPVRASAIGRAVHSVWQGPKQIRSGAPVLTRNKTA